MLKALAALREAMGVSHDYPLEIAVVDLPPAVIEVKSDVDNKVKIDYRPLYKFDKAELIAAALANRGEMMQANSASRVTELEVRAQSLTRGLQSKTFAWSADIHAKPIPQGIFNNEYRPGAIGLEMPPFLGGRKSDRVQRASDLNQRASAVVDKTQNLVSLDVEAQFLKWQEAVEDIQNLREIYDTAQKLPGQVLKLMQNKDLTGIAIIQSNMTAIQVRTQLNDEMHIHALALAGLERATAGAFRVYPIPAVMPKQN
jgi:outer membrane protein TolC